MRKELWKRKLGFSGFLLLLLTYLLLMGVSSFAAWAAEEYPNRPITMIVPFAPGGGSDLGSKVISDKISEFLGQPLISVHKPGGGGSLGAAFVAKSKPNGYTILVSDLSAHVLPPIVKKVDFVFDDFIPIGAYGMIPVWLAVKADSRWKTLNDLIVEEKKSPGKLKVGTYGTLTVAHFILELINKYGGVKLTHVPFKSSGEVLTQMLGGHIDAGMIAGAGGYLESGVVRILAVADKKRLDGLPDIPTFIESGYPIAISPRYSLCFPKGTPEEIVNKFSKALEMAFNRYGKEIKEGLRRVEIWAVFLNREEALKHYKTQYELLYKIAEELDALVK